MHQERAVVPWSSTVPVLKREAQTVRDSLEPANERHTAFAGMCADSWASLDFMMVWDFPWHLEGLGACTLLAPSGAMAPSFPMLLWPSSMAMSENRQTYRQFFFPFFFFCDVVLFSSDMGMNVNFKKSSSKQGKNTQRGVWDSSAARCPKSRGSWCPLPGVAGCGHCAILGLSPAPGLAALSPHSLLAKPPAEGLSGR